MKSTEVQYCNKTLGVVFYLSAVVQNLFHAFVYIILVTKCINVFVYYGFVQEVGTFCGG